MTTSEPSLAREIHEAAKAKGVSRSTPRSPAATSAHERARSRSWSAATRTWSRGQPLFECMGKTIVHQGGRRRRAAHQDGQPDPDRANMIGVCEGLALRLQGGPRPRDGAAVGRQRRGRQLVAREPRPADHRRELRARVSSSSTSSRTWASPWTRRSGWAWPCRAWRSRTSSTSRCRRRATAARHAGPGAGARAHFQRSPAPDADAMHDSGIDRIDRAAGRDGRLAATRSPDHPSNNRLPHR